MTVLRVEIQENQNLAALEEVLDQLGMSYRFEEDGVTDFPDQAVLGINAGLADFENGRTSSHQTARDRIESKIYALKSRYGA